MKQTTTTFLFSLLIGIAFIACDTTNNGNNNPAEQPKNQSQTITFGADLSTTVTGNMTDTQWNAVIDKLTTALNAAAATEGNLGTRTTSLFGMEVGIDLVKPQKDDYYNYYKMVSGKFLFNIDYVIGVTQADLSVKVAMAINAVFDGGPFQE